MILPQDTKEPLADTDSELDFDIDEDDFVPPYSPTEPYRSGDIELCPPPYYARFEELDDSKRPLSVRERLQKRRVRILWSCLGVIAIYTVIVTFFARHHRHHHRPPPPHPFGGHHHPPPPPPFDAPWEDDWVGGANCAVFPPGSPTPSGQRSSNASFLLSTTEGAELFDTYSGDAFVSSVFVTSYDADEDDDGIYYGDTRPKAGEYVRMTVEAIYDGEADEGPGWDMLQSSDVCLQLVEGRRLEPHTRDETGEGYGAVRRLGVGLRSVRTEGKLPLSFRLHVKVPRAPAQLDAEAQSTLPIPPLMLQSAAGVYVADLGVPLSALRIRNAAGQIEVQELSAEIASFHTSGQVKGSLSIAKELEVRAEAGDVDLDLSLAPTPLVSFFDYDSGCSPVEINLRTGAGSTTLRHSEWAECRSLREKVSASAGSIDIIPHAQFEGKFGLHTSAGTVDVSENAVQDPTGRDRSRVIRKQERGRWGSRRVEGSVSWDGRGGDSLLVAETRAGSVKVAF